MEGGEPGDEATMYVHVLSESIGRSTYDCYTVLIRCKVFGNIMPMLFISFSVKGDHVHTGRHTRLLILYMPA